MTKSAQNKTAPTKRSVSTFIADVEPAQRADAKTLLKLFKDITGCRARLWGDSLIGFGSYHYKYDSGREGNFLATGFSIRKSGPTIYIMPGYTDYSDLLAELGPHKLGKSCLYIKNLDTIDLTVLRTLIETGLKDLAKKYPVKMK